MVTTAVRATPPRLILVSSHYPYGAGEAFLEPELAELAKRFDIVLLPLQQGGAARHLPEGVAVEPSVYGRSKLWFYIRRALAPRSWQLLVAEASRLFRQTGFSWQQLKRFAMAACQRSALERRVRALLRVNLVRETLLYSYWGYGTSFAVPEAARAGVRCCVRFHGSDLYSDLEGSADQCIAWRHEIASKTAIALFVSQHGLDHYRSRILAGTRAKPRLEVARLGVRDRGVNPAAKSERLIVVSCSLIIPLKRVHLISRFVKALAVHRPVEWHHFGGGSYPEFETERETDSPALVTVLHGMLPRSDIMAFYQTCHVDLFVNMSTTEGVPVSIMEAMSFGIPSLATDVGGTSEAVVTGRSGLLVAPEDCLDSDGLAQTVLREFESGGSLQRSDPRAFWRERYDAARNFPHLGELLDEMLHSPAIPR